MIIKIVGIFIVLSILGTINSTESRNKTSESYNEVLLIRG